MKRAKYNNRDRNQDRSKHHRDRANKKRKLDAILEEVRRIRDDISNSSSASKYDSSSSSSSASDTEEMTHSSGQTVETNNEQDKDKTTTTEENPNILIDLLGSNPDNLNKQIDPLHEEICLRWDVYLKQGLNKEQKEELMKKYPIFENCKLMTPPKLNAEIQQCMDNKATRHDQFLEKLQLQTAHALSATGVELNRVLKSEDQEKSKETCSTLADIGQLLCNIHHAITTSRKYQILPYLNYNSRKLIENSSRDEFLLGSKFAEDVKATEAVQKVAKDLKIISKKNFTNKPSTSNQQPQSSEYNSKNNKKQREHLNYSRRRQSPKKKFNRDYHQNHRRRSPTRRR
ncbi:uncharacterized protein LOC127278590 [Leptopilina boulardi]|uniref:uncharacterized protein LOC127278590 n=1 Tax=Leptopilina boulardi TaxID=63433 RepID=UPI0021F572BD|nr:uncharacterized protein LOC127278590 [Leptopilina boulardi]